MKISKSNELVMARLIGEELSRWYIFDRSILGSKAVSSMKYKKQRSGAFIGRLEQQTITDFAEISKDSGFFGDMMNYEEFFNRAKLGYYINLGAAMLQTKGKTYPALNPEDCLDIISSLYGLIESEGDIWMRSSKPESDSLNDIATEVLREP